MWPRLMCDKYRHAGILMMKIEKNTVRVLVQLAALCHM